jgi:hypothetical protein
MGRSRKESLCWWGNVCLPHWASVHLCVLWKLQHFWAKLNLGKLGTYRKILHLRLTMLWLRDCPHLARNHPCPTHSSIIEWKSPGSSLPIGYHRFEKHLKSGNKLSRLADSTWTPPCFPLYFPFLTFNKLDLHPCVLPWILPEGHKDLEVFWSQTAPAPLILFFSYPFNHSHWSLFLSVTFILPGALLRLLLKGKIFSPPKSN